jgi:hypothetical protein
MIWRKLCHVIAVCAAITMAPNLSAQLKEVGDIGSDFTIQNLGASGTLQLSDFEGSIVVLDFFFYW